MGAPALDYPAWDHFSTGTWSADTVSDPSMNESMPIGQDFLAFSPQGVANAGPDMSFPAWCSPQDTIATTSLPMLVNDASDDLKFMPQTAGFVGSPAHSALSHAGSDARDGSNYAYNNATLAHPRLVRPQVAPSYMTQDAIQEPQPTGAVNEHASQSASSYVQPRRISILAQQQNHQVRPVPASLRLARYPELKTNPSPASTTTYPRLVPNIRPNLDSGSSAQSLKSISPMSAAGGVAMNTEESDRRFRTHPLYQAGPQDDGSYHCPFLEEADCNHRPTKLKCNYDKYIDSHIRPFRCKSEACNNTQFSSTACLLRHEREAHGLHGHGNRPYLCEYKECERAAPDNGFPRHYNLLDHMKRVHDYNPPKPTSDTSAAPSATNKDAKKQTKSRKRRAPSPGEGPATQRARTAGAGKSTPRPSATKVVQSQEQRQSLRSQWYSQKQMLEQQLQRMQPNDAASFQKLQQDIAALQRLSQQSNGYE